MAGHSSWDDLPGAGTQADPKLIADVYDFIAMLSQDVQAPEYAKLTADIDFNDHETYKYGITGKLPYNSSGMNQLHLEGDGHEIRNIVISDIIFSTSSSYGSKFTGVLYIGYISNVNFANIVLSNCGTYYTTAISESWIRSHKYDHCSFGISTFGARDITHVLPGVISDSDVGLEFCTIKIQGVFTKQSSGSNGDRPILLFGKKPIHHSNIDLDIVADTSGDNNMNLYCALFGGLILDSSYITGKMHSTKRYYQFSYFGSSENDYKSTLTSAFIAVETEYVASNAVKLNYGDSVTVQATSWMDKDILGYAPTSGSINNFHLLKTTDAQDPDYLNSIGYQVGKKTD